MLFEEMEESKRPFWRIRLIPSGSWMALIEVISKSLKLKKAAPTFFFLAQRDCNIVFNLILSHNACSPGSIITWLYRPLGVIRMAMELPNYTGLGWRRPCWHGGMNEKSEAHFPNVALSTSVLFLVRIVFMSMYKAHNCGDAVPIRTILLSGWQWDRIWFCVSAIISPKICSGLISLPPTQSPCVWPARNKNGQDVVLTKHGC